MAFDPTLPATGAELRSAELRNQFNGLKTLIDAVPAGPQGEQGPPGADGAPGRDVVNVSDDGNGRAIIQMSDGTTYGPFTVATGPQGPQGEQGPQGDPGPQSEQGPPGEVSSQQLSDAIAGTANNPSDVETLDLTVSDPPTQSEVQAVVDKLNELINALKR